MQKVKYLLKRNGIFILIGIILVLVSFIAAFRNYVGKDPFAGTESLENSVRGILTDQYHVFVTDASSTLIVTDQNNVLLYRLEGGDKENTFEEADDVAINDDGTLYVIETIWNEQGNICIGNRILKFTENGKKREELFEVGKTGIQDAEEESLEEEPEEIDTETEIWLDSPVIIDGVLHFSAMAPDGIYLYQENNLSEPYAFMPIESANLFVMDTSFSRDGKIAAAFANGDILEQKDGEISRIFDARAEDNENYVSLVTDIAYDNEESLYYLDMGLRQVGKITGGKKEICIETAAFSDPKPASFAEAPLYSALNLTKNYVSVLSTSYICDTETEEEYYLYAINGINLADGTSVSFDSFSLPLSLKILYGAIWVALITLNITVLISVFRFLRFLKNSEFTSDNTQLLVLVMSIAVTIGVSTSIFTSYNQRYTKESTENLTNIAYLLQSEIDPDLLKSLDSPDKFTDEAYRKMDEKICSILQNDTNRANGIYAVIYREYNNIVHEVYRDDGMHGIMYPMAGIYENSSEQRIAESGQPDTLEDFEISEGSYIFVLIPVYDKNDDILAFIEVGESYEYVARENQELSTKILINTAMAIIIIMLLFGEFSYAGKAFSARKRAIKEKKTLPPEVLRPLIFMIFFTCNITTAFLPVYGMSLWNEKFPFSAEIGAALPLSNELIISAGSALLCGFIIHKIGIRRTLCIGAVCYIAGNLLSVFAGNLWVLILANSTCGFGGGFLSVAINTWITGFETEEQKNTGFIHYNSGYLAGMNCGTVIGSLLQERFNYAIAYYVAAGSAVLIFLLAFIIAKNLNSVEAETDVEAEKTEAAVGEITAVKSGNVALAASAAVSAAEAREAIRTGKTEELRRTRLGALKKFLTPRIFAYFVLFSFPYLTCASFLTYYFPVIAEKHALSAAELSMAFLINGVISIHTGSAIGESVIAYLGARRSMSLASLIYIIALLGVAVNPDVMTCYAAIAMFAIADSFGLSAQSVYFSSLDETQAIGESRALGISSTLEAIIAANGSLVFSTVLLLGDSLGLFIITGIFTIMSLIYALGGSRLSQMDEPEFEAELLETKNNFEQEAVSTEAEISSEQEAVPTEAEISSEQETVSQKEELLMIPKIMHPNRKQIPRLKEIWCESFPEDAESGYCNFYFKHHFSPENSLILCTPEDIESAAYMFTAYYPDADGNKQKMLYFYAGSTAVRYRGKHNFKKLVTGLLEEAIQKDCRAVFWLGAEHLISTYDRWHCPRTAPMHTYHTVIPHPENKIPDLHICEYELFASLREQFLVQIGNAVRWTDESNRYMYQDIFTKGFVLTFRQNTFYAVCTKEENEIIIRETNVPPENWYLLCESVLNYFQISGDITVYHYQEVPADLFMHSQIYYGHFVLLQNFPGCEKLQSVYINLVAD